MTLPINQHQTRRPIRARDSKWAASTARWLAQIGLRPNQISLLSIIFAAIAGGALLVSGLTDSTPVLVLLYLAAALGIQMRLLCNLFDGMIAVEGGLRTKSGEIYNELPDRFADALILTGAGYSFPAYGWLPILGWSAAMLAVITAYVRTLGAAAGAGQYFLGPMAKPHRMAVMTIALLASAAGEFFSIRGIWVAAALAIVVIGCMVTIGRRVQRIVAELESK